MKHSKPTFSTRNKKHTPLLANLQFVGLGISYVFEDSYDTALNCEKLAFLYLFSGQT